MSPGNKPTASVTSRGVVGREFGKEMYERHSEGQIYEPIGRKIQELIMKTERYIVFIDEYGNVQWAHSPLPQIKEEDYDAVCNKVAELEVRSRFLRLHGGPAPDSSTDAPPNEGIDFPTYQHALFSARRLIAEGMARLLDSTADVASPNAAFGILDTADKWITQRSTETSREWFLRPFGVLGSLAFLAALVTICASFDDLGGNAAASMQQIALLISSTLLGGVGAFISATVLNKKIPFDATAGKKLHHLEAYMRFGTGLAAGFTIILLIKGGIFLSMLKEQGNGSLAACLVLGLLAGGSELFLPTLLTRFEDSLVVKEATK